MKTRVQKWGNSFALRIPKSFAAEVGLDRDALVDLSLKGGKLIVEPLPKSPMNLEELLAAVIPENLHAEVDTGPPVGREKWF
jgi:antitoxin MazE